MDPAQLGLPEGTKITVIYQRVPEPTSFLDEPLPKRGKPDIEFDLDIYNRHNPHFTPAPRGGSAHVVIELPNGRVFIGVSVCSFSDQFNYKRGRDIALGRALKVAQAALSAS